MDSLKKVKVSPLQAMNTHGDVELQVMNAQGDVDARVNIFTATALGTGKVTSPMLGHLYPRESPGTHFAGIDSRTSLDTNE